MRIAYLLLVHKSPSQIARLLRAIYAPGNFYGVHVDRKAPKEIHTAIAAICGEYPQAFLIPPQVINWGGWSAVAAELISLAALLERSTAWDRVVCLSGQDFPLISQTRLREALDQDPALNYLNCAPFDSLPVYKLKRVDFYHVELFRRVQRLPLRRRRPGDFVIHHGDQWFMITRAFAEFCVNDPLSRRIQKYLRFTHVPDEAFFQTVIMNSKFAPTCAHRALRKINWLASGGPSPGIITMKDVDWLLEGDACFARKFDETVDSQVLELLESRLRETAVRS